MTCLEDRVRALYRPDVAGSPPAVHLVTGEGYPAVETLGELAQAAATAGQSELHVLAWKHPEDVVRTLRIIAVDLAVPVRQVLLPREVLGRLSRKPPVFREMGELTARTVTHADGSLDVELLRFLPGRPISPDRGPEALADRAVKSGFDFIDYWAVDFDHEPSGPFHHRWHWGRSSRGRRIPLISDARVSRRKGEHSRLIAVKITDVFGYETVTYVDPV